MKYKILNSNFGDAVPEDAVSTLMSVGVMLLIKTRERERGKIRDTKCHFRCLSLVFLCRPSVRPSIHKKFLRFQCNWSMSNA